MSEKERERASGVKNKCDLIRPHEAFYITSSLLGLNVTQRVLLLLCVCVCINVCYHGPQKVTLPARDLTIFMYVFLGPRVCSLVSKSTEFCVRLSEYLYILIYMSQSLIIPVHTVNCVCVCGCVCVCCIGAEECWLDCKTWPFLLWSH